MLDLTSTNPSVDAQTRACAHLLAAVIAQAVKDAAVPPFKFERSQKFNFKSEARKAIPWLFTPGTPFDAYCRLIGVEPQALRDALESNRTLNPKLKQYFSTDDRRIIKIRLQWWKAELSDPSGFQAALEKYQEMQKKNPKKNSDLQEDEEIQ